MSTPTSGHHDPYHRFWEQFHAVQQVHAALDPATTLLVEPAEATPGSGIAPRYVYEARAVLIRDADMPAVRLHTASPDVDSGTPGVRKLLLDPGLHVPTEVARLNRVSREAGQDHGRPAGPMATPSHLVSIAPVNLCPAGEPRPVPPATPLWPYPHQGPTQPGAGQPAAGSHPVPGTGVSVLVIDTGFQPDAAAVHPALAGVSLIAGEPPRVATDPGTGVIKEYAGHGTFVTGVLRSVAPGTQVTVSSALQNAGAILEHDLGGAILTALDAVAVNGRWPDIISLSAGATSQDNQELITLDPLFQRLATEQTHTVLIAGAGNDGTSEHLFWPAASATTRPGVISVGALRRDGRGRACFSNHGDWVTVYAYGEQIINYFLTGFYADQHDSTPACRYYSPPLYPDCGCVQPPTSYGDVVYFDGLASWSGTSFATPLVAGLVAAQMTATGQTNARTAARDLLSGSATTISDAGDQEKLLALR